MSTSEVQIPKYRVLEVSFIDNHLRQPGEVIEYDGLPSGNLEPLCDTGRARAQVAIEKSKELLASIVGAPTQTYRALDAKAYSGEVVALVRKAIGP